MAYNYEYPYTDPNRYNSDWVLKKIIQLTKEWAATLKDWNEQKDAFEEFKKFVTSYLTDLDLQTEVNKKLDEMEKDGTLSLLLSVIMSPITSQFESVKNDVEYIKTYLSTFTGSADNVSTMDERGSIYASLSDRFNVEASEDIVYAYTSPFEHGYYTKDLEKQDVDNGCYTTATFIADRYMYCIYDEPYEKSVVFGHIEEGEFVPTQRVYMGVGSAGDGIFYIESTDTHFKVEYFNSEGTIDLAQSVGIFVLKSKEYKLNAIKAEYPLRFYDYRDDGTYVESPNVCTALTYVKGAKSILLTLPSCFFKVSYFDKDMNFLGNVYASKKYGGLKYTEVPEQLNGIDVVYAYISVWDRGKNRVHNMVAYRSIVNEHLFKIYDYNTISETPREYAQVIINANKIIESLFLFTNKLQINSRSITYNAGDYCYGVPYSSIWRHPRKPFIHVSHETYVTCLLNPHGVMYQPDTSAAYNYQQFYGLVCSDFVSLCMGIYPPMSTSTMYKKYPTEALTHVGESQVGDIILTNVNEEDAHAMIVVNKRYDLNNDLLEVECIEEWSPLIRKRIFTAEDNFYVPGAEVILRVIVEPNAKPIEIYMQPEFNELTGEITNNYPNFTVLPDRGNKAVYMLGETITANVLDSTKTNLYIYRNDSLVHTVTTSSGTVSDDIIDMDITEYCDVAGKYTLSTGEAVVAEILVVEHKELGGEVGEVLKLPESEYVADYWIKYNIERGGMDTGLVSDGLPIIEDGYGYGVYYKTDFNMFVYWTPNTGLLN